LGVGVVSVRTLCSWVGSFVKGSDVRNLSISLAALVAAAGSASAATVFFDDFENGGIGQFSYEDYQPGGSLFKWDSNVAGDEGNYTGGSGNAATSNSIFAGVGEYDHAIVSPEINLGTDSELTYLTNYQNFALLDFADVDISNDGGQSWKNLLRWNSDHGAPFDLPGESVVIDLSAYDNQTVNIRFHHYDPNTDDFDLYWMVDNVRVTAVPVPGAIALLGLGGLCTARRRRA
jgi:hypothetical protein